MAVNGEKQTTLASSSHRAGGTNRWDLLKSKDFSKMEYIS